MATNNWMIIFDAPRVWLCKLANSETSYSNGATCLLQTKTTQPPATLYWYWLDLSDSISAEQKLYANLVIRNKKRSSSSASCTAAKEVSRLAKGYNWIKSIK